MVLSNPRTYCKRVWRLARASREEKLAILRDVLEASCDLYDDILVEGQLDWENDSTLHLVQEEVEKRKKSKTANLGARMTLHKKATLQFLEDDYILFDNNQAERVFAWLK
ncbi:Transposase IS66 family protein [Paenibacillus algorifonticola]|uniref:Transposase IS66 family protein n=1 Tax=Paenibacillus algorifonticola TaxID=684063 RepID=A0A1I2CNR1_9BACL|nr:transposase [Paenibacillus algorifonticola]SFE69936.1 Transposase IS66 family protein [Paenibacillus algorifonticola]